jgi:hypothetical protein
MYENSIMKPIKSCKRIKRGGACGEGERKQERVIKKVNLAKVQYMHAWNYHNETPLHN